MASLIKISLLIFLLLFLNMFSGKVEGFGHGERKPQYLPKNKGIVDEKKIMMRKLLISVDAILDYDRPGPNPKHEKRPGGGY
ncbi:uncharacterized protein LOC115717082 [Cannabis sativa]|nr:uncharacterized protein LOC115717082 [Cannabis sativa]